MPKKLIFITTSIIIIILCGGAALAKKSALLSGKNANENIAESKNQKDLKDKNSNKDKEGDQQPENKKEEALPISPISGIASANGNRRPFAVMLAADGSTRPLAGIGQADLVVEIPVIKNGINRFMAVYATEDPADIGSVRSARHDFIPLAKGVNAIFAHWGGSHFALDKLNARAINNLDALGNPYGAFYRKKGISAPDNGFTSMKRMTDSASKLEYDLKNTQKAQNFISEDDWNPEADGWIYDGNDISINYPGSKIEWRFNKEDKLYYRFRSGTPEADKNTGKQVSARVIALISAASRHLEGQYNEVDIEGSGDLKVFQKGFFLKGKWNKDKRDQSSPMKFINNNGYEIQLLAGQRWWEINDLF